MSYEMDSRVALQEINGKGKGYVASDDIPCGTLLLREEALELARGGDERDKMLVLNHLLQSVHTRVMRDAAAREIVFSLYPSRAESDRDFTRRDPNENAPEGEEFPPQLVDELNHLHNILCCNTFLVEDLTGTGEVSFALFTRTSRTNHSCAPLCAYYFVGRDIHLRATRDIKKGEEITISYCSAYLGRAKRQRHLLENYHFKCACERCGTQAGVDVVLDALLCPTEDCMGFVTTDFAGASRCTECRADRDQAWVAGRRAELARRAKASPLKSDAILALAHPKSDDAYQAYSRQMLHAISMLRQGKLTPESRKQGLQGAKSVVACLQGTEAAPEETLLTVLKAASLAAPAEKEALLKKASGMCATLRGDGDLKKYFPGWAK